MELEQLQPEQLQQSLGEVARAARERLGLTQAQVARQAGIAANVYGRIERGGMMPAVPTLRKLARTLGISADALLALSSADVAASVDAPAPEGNLSPELLQLVSMLRGWSPAKVKRLIRVLKVLENATDDE
ncbi:helix-turn-helix transcriptional regulator [Archangium violaceum]|jgi:transcriptional regulator with XRE-family HTH domain|uniref:helix-turn-helix domain-containing protein n=1 Tax=Archangium violaceum TaxID=83451 RepID=UPI00193BFE1A|nr:helix-turn-helix transcriptional regulator [Archangium violaceum]QRK07793.1 helix-turn-helix transcriptional regulator [Archangium violaceum]QRK12315.1 helix-turn-helix transcriptional regulator [Archangium violaceum]HLM46280.1 helix-turn-helix transcriptional regulator [Myxococcaceae bacterium]